MNRDQLVRSAQCVDEQGRALKFRKSEGGRDADHINLEVHYEAGQASQATSFVATVVDRAAN